MPPCYGVRRERPPAPPPVRLAPAFCRRGRLGNGGLARPPALLGRRRCGFVGNRLCGRCRFGISLGADRRRQERCVKRGGCLLGFNLCTTRTTLGSRTQSTRRAGHEWIVVGVGNRLALDGRNAFTGQNLGDGGFAFRIAVAVAIEAAAAVTTAFATLGPILALAFLAGPLVTGAVFTITATFIAVTPILTITALLALAAILAIFAVLTFAPVRDRAVKRREIALDAEVVGAFFGILILPAFAAVLAGPLLFLTETGIGDHTEIVVGELEVVFGLHAVAIKVGVLRELAILLQHLGRIAPGATVDPVELLTTVLGATVVAPTATAVVTTIVIQLRHFLKWGGLS